MPVGPLFSFVSERQTIGRQAQVYGPGSLLRLVNVGIASDVTYEPGDGRIGLSSVQWLVFRLEPVLSHTSLGHQRNVELYRALHP